MLIATTHPWWAGGTPLPAFTLATMDITFAGSGASAVKATAICNGHCPVRLSEGDSQVLAFTVTPTVTISGCNPAVYYSVTKVNETSTGGAFVVTHVGAGVSNAPLPVTLPNPLGGPTCVLTAEVWVTFEVRDLGPSTQSPALKVTVVQS